MQELLIDPIIFKLSSTERNILENETKEPVIISSTINHPLLSLGYHYFLRRTRNDMINKIKKISNNSKFYNVINPFESDIPNYDEGLDKLTNIYLNSKTKDVKPRSFYKLWEMLFIFDLTDVKTKDFVYTSFDKVDSGFPKAFASYKEKIDSNTKYIINDLNNNFSKEVDKLKSSAHLITGNCRLDLSLENKLDQEQYSYELIFAEIVAALKSQEDNGHFILRVFDTFTLVTLKMIYMLTYYYEEVYVYKPYFSRPVSNEKYIICKKFKKKLMKSNTIKYLELILSKMNTKEYIYSILPDVDLPDEFVRLFAFINLQLVNPQQTMINQMITFIEENNYYGDKYHKYRDNQINATKWWSRLFYAPSKNLTEKNREDLLKKLKTSYTTRGLEATQQYKQLL